MDREKLAKQFSEELMDKMFRAKKDFSGITLGPSSDKTRSITPSISVMLRV